MPQLAALFALTALLYALVGFGGGSTYNALLVLNGTDYRILPAIALICNIIVVAGGSWRFWQAGHVSFWRILPWILLSVPAAWLGGRLAVSETLFVGLLGGSLLVAGLQLIFERKQGGEDGAARHVARPVSYAAGGGIGFLSGMVGIGGGIFLAPILYLLRWGGAGDCRDSEHLHPGEFAGRSRRAADEAGGGLRHRERHRPFTRLLAALSGRSDRRADRFAVRQHAHTVCARQTVDGCFDPICRHAVAVALVSAHSVLAY